MFLEETKWNINHVVPIFDTMERICYHGCYGEGFHSQCMLGNFRAATFNDNLVKF